MRGYPEGAAGAAPVTVRSVPGARPVQLATFVNAAARRILDETCGRRESNRSAHPAVPQFAFSQDVRKDSISSGRSWRSG